jgi:hypothetical protein
MKIRFVFGKPKNPKLKKDILQVGITIGGKSLKSKFSTGISVAKRYWDAKNQLILNSQADNKQLFQIKEDLNDWS